MLNQNQTLNFGSYRTYEEWKHILESQTDKEIVSSYRTYEEWKHAHQIINDEPSLSVLTVPMRNGNSPEELEVLKQLQSVLTVPMRNGNLR